MILCVLFTVFEMIYLFGQYKKKKLGANITFKFDTPAEMYGFTCFVSKVSFENVCSVCNVIFKFIKCNDCPKFYTGQTGIYIKAHTRTTKSNLADYIYITI